LGEQFLRKIAKGFKVRGDQSAKALAAPTLFSNKHEIVATDFVVTPTHDAALQAGDRVHVENGSDGVRLIKGNRAVGTVEVPPSFRDAIAARGVAAAVVHECSPFGAVSIRIREEEAHVP